MLVCWRICWNESKILTAGSESCRFCWLTLHELLFFFWGTSTESGFIQHKRNNMSNRWWHTVKRKQLLHSIRILGRSQSVKIILSLVSQENTISQSVLSEIIIKFLQLIWNSSVLLRQNHHTDTVEERIHRTAVGRLIQENGFFFKVLSLNSFRELQKKNYATECLEGFLYQG